MKKKLTQRQEAALKRHSVHHTKSVLAKMRRQMEQGMSFTQAHKNAPKKKK